MKRVSGPTQKEFNRRIENKLQNTICWKCRFFSNECLRCFNQLAYNQFRQVCCINTEENYSSCNFFEDKDDTFFEDLEKDPNGYEIRQRD